VNRIGSAGGSRCCSGTAFANPSPLAARIATPSGNAMIDGLDILETV
jgi:hypothetical protein